MSEACTKCGGTDHYGKEVCVSEGSCNLLPITGLFQVPYLVIRACGKCGFVEFRVPERFLAKLPERFPRVP